MFNIWHCIRLTKANVKINYLGKTSSILKKLKHFLKTNQDVVHPYFNVVYENMKK